MKKTTFGMGAVAVGLALLALSATSSPAAQRPGYETYVVRKGDTLAKISGRVFGDTKRWREILKDNPQVTNANLIYPGDTLLVPVPETAAPSGGTGGGLAARAGAEAGPSDAGSGSTRTEIVAAPAATSDQGAVGSGSNPAAASGGGAGAGAEAGANIAAAVPEPSVERVRSAALVNPALYRAAGYIADKLPAIAIVASQDDRILLGTNDAAIVNAPISPGTRFTLVRANRRIFHPVTGAYLGWLIRVLGTAEVTCRGERTSTVALRTTNDAASIGDYLIPVDPNDVLEQNVLAGNMQPECIPAGARDGVIVAFNDDRNAVGEQDLVYIDIGTASGVTPGRRFTIYRQIAPEGRIPVGELQVLRAGVKTSTALITTSFREVQVGFLLRAR
jgi:LysM repeat protein